MVPSVFCGVRIVLGFALRSRLKNKEGFTILEIIVVIVLVGILGAVFMPLLSDSTVSLQSAAQTVRTDLKFAQQLAMERNPASGSPIGITFAASSGSYSLTDPVGAVSFTRNLPAGITIGTGGTINFNKYGEPQTISTITITSGAASKSITVEAFSGTVSVT